MLTPISRAAAGAVRRALDWPARMSETRRAMTQLARMSDRELSDIGLIRQDVIDVSALRLSATRPDRPARSQSRRDR